MGRWLDARGCLPVDVGESGVAGLAELWLDCNDDSEPERERTRASEACVAGDAGIDDGTCEALELPMAVTMAGVAAAAALAAGSNLDSVPLAVIPPAALAGAGDVASSNRCAAAPIGCVIVPKPIGAGALMPAASVAPVEGMSGAPDRSDAYVSKMSSGLTE